MLIKKANQNALKVGILVPQSRQYPKVSLDFVNSIKLYFTLHENQFSRGKVELFVEEVGFGAEITSIEKVNKLVLQDEVVMILGLLEFSVASQVARVADAASIPILISGLGESSVSVNGLPQNLFFHSFMLWQSYLMLGKYLAKTIDVQRTAIVSTLYDCGYDTYRAFKLGLNATAFAPDRDLVTSGSTDEEQANEIVWHLRKQSENLPCFLLHPRVLNTVLKKIGTQMTQQPIILPFYYGADNNTKMWASVHAAFNPKAMMLQDGVAEYLDTDCTVHHMLGFAVAQLLYDAISELDDPELDTDKILEFWGNYDEETITGRCQFRSESRHFESDIHVFAGVNLNDSSIVKSYPVGATHSEIEKELHGLKTSYTNPYLCF